MSARGRYRAGKPLPPECYRPVDSTSDDDEEVTIFNLATYWRKRWEDAEERCGRAEKEASGLFLEKMGLKQRLDQAWVANQALHKENNPLRLEVATLDEKMECRVFARGADPGPAKPNPSVDPCYNCRHHGHKHFRCPHRTRCYNCNQMGHDRSTCTQPRRARGTCYRCGSHAHVDGQCRF